MTSTTLKRVSATLLLMAWFCGNPPVFSKWLYAAPKAEAKAVAPESPVINLNRATAEELQAVRGIGPALAERVIQYREEHGRFERPEDLVNVRGIGEAKFERIKNQVSI